MRVEENVQDLLYKLVDPTVVFPDGHPMPLLTTMLYRVCDTDHAKFEEAARLLELAITQALETRTTAEREPRVVCIAYDSAGGVLCIRNTRQSAADLTANFKGQVEIVEFVERIE